MKTVVGWTSAVMLFAISSSDDVCTIGRGFATSGNVCLAIAAVAFAVGSLDRVHVGWLLVVLVVHLVREDWKEVVDFCAGLVDVTLVFDRSGDEVAIVGVCWVLTGGELACELVENFAVWEELAGDLELGLNLREEIHKSDWNLLRRQVFDETVEQIKEGCHGRVGQRQLAEFRPRTHLRETRHESAERTLQGEERANGVVVRDVGRDHDAHRSGREHFGEEVAEGRAEWFGVLDQCGGLDAVES